MKIKRYQEGGAVAPVEQPMPNAPVENADPIQQIAEMAVGALQSQDCGLAMQVCEAFVTLLQDAMGGQPQGPVSAPPQGEPVFRKGGVMVRRK